MSVAPLRRMETTEAKELQLSLSVAQHHLPALDLFWASFFVRVQLTSLFLISLGLWTIVVMPNADHDRSFYSVSLWTLKLQQHPGWGDMKEYNNNLTGCHAQNDQYDWKRRARLRM